MKPPRQLQYPAEIAALAHLMREENCTSLIEIGCKAGGSLWTLSQALPKGARVVAVSLPAGDDADPVIGRASRVSLQDCITELRGQGYEAHLVWGDSAASKTVERVRPLAPFDMCFIDANHTLPFIESDWRNYGAMARLVAFHDIAWARPEDWGGGYHRIEVPEFWHALKAHYPHKEFRFDPTGRDNGIGVLWRH